MSKIYAVLLANHRRKWSEIPNDLGLKEAICGILNGWVTSGDLTADEYDSIINGTY